MLNDEARAVLEAYRGELEEELPAPERHWDRLVARIDEGAPPLELDDEEPPGSRRRWWVLGALAAAGLGALMFWPRPDRAQGSNARNVDVEAVYGVRAEEREHVLESPPQRVEPARRPSATSTHSDADAEPRLVPPQSEEVLDETPKVRPGPRRPQPRPSPEAEFEPALSAEPGSTEPSPTPASLPMRSSLVAEAKLLRRARAALRDGDADRALALVRQHQARFPDPELRDERRVLEADALCAAGRADAARRVARAFVRTNPRSPLASRARELCLEP